MKAYVVTGGARGVGRAIAERLSDGGRVVTVDLHGPADVVGDAGDDEVLARAVELAGPELAGWVNNAALFRDAALHEVASSELVALIAANLAPAVAGARAAVRAYLANGVAGRDRQRLLPPGAARRPRRAAVRDRQGGDRGAHARAGRRLRAARDPHQRRRARLDRHRAL